MAKKKAPCTHHWVQVVDRKKQPIRKEASFIFKIADINTRIGKEGMDFKTRGSKEETLSCTLWRCKKCKIKGLFASSYLMIVSDPSVWSLKPRKRFRVAPKK